MTVAGTVAAQGPAPDKQACAQAFEDAQTKQKEGRLKAAQAAAITCAHEACQSALRSECVAWVDELRLLMPSIVVTAKDASGADISVARVLVDGAVVASRVDGKPLELDPGEHELRVEPPAGEPLVTRVVVAQGQRGRLVALQAAAAAVPPPEISSGGISPLAPIGFAIAGAGLVVGSITGGLAFSAAAYCRDNGCTEDELDSKKSIAHASTASFAIGAAGLVLGIVGMVIPTGAETETGAAPRAVPLLGPAYAGLAGSF
ncbi:MAG: hypothetical protein IT373_25425 [Polyangiaceae bacterium]|nr:hypothetical protein [Polyangiaceae bacterium]